MSQKLFLLALLFFTFYSVAQNGVFVGKAEFLGESRQVSTLAEKPIYHQMETYEIGAKNKRHRPLEINEVALPESYDPIQQKYFGAIPSKGININFTAQSGTFPPDPTGAAGPNHYVQAVNKQFQVFDKQGNPMGEAKPLNSLWPGSSNQGDPIVMYDRHADRWVITQFQPGNKKILYAVSSSEDPLGTYYGYSFTFPNFPDYPKYSIWSDGYYMTCNSVSKNVAAFNRDSMLAGAATVPFVILDLPEMKSHFDFISVLPADADGDLPPYGTPNYLFHFQDDAWADSTLDEIRILKMEVEWDDLANSSISVHQSLYPSSFNSVFTEEWDDIPQKGTTQKIDAVSSIFNYRAQYLRWGGYNTVMLCHVVDIDDSNTAGIRWYELRQDEMTSQFSVFQEGTYAPADGNSRFLGSIAMNGSGYIGLAYSISGTDMYPSLGYTGRLPWNPPGEMTLQEIIAKEGTGFQSNSNRYGDYSHMSLDPNGHTFWFTGEFIGDNGARKTQVFSFDVVGQAGLESKSAIGDLSAFQIQEQLKVAYDVNLNEEIEFRVYESSGRVLKSWNRLINGSINESFNIADLKQGVHIISIQGKALFKTIKIVIN